MLAALHLGRGGTHVTMNLDRGVEVAQELMTSARGDAADPVIAEALERWRHAVRENLAPLRVVASRVEFAGWIDDGCPAALLKVHGTVGASGELIDVVLEDTEELGGLYPARAASLGSAPAR